MAGKGLEQAGFSGAGAARCNEKVIGHRAIDVCGSYDSSSGGSVKRAWRGGAVPVRK